MNTTNLLIAGVSTVVSIVFFSAIEAREDHLPESIKLLGDEGKASSRFNESLKAATLPQPITTADGSLMYPVSDIDAPGANPRFDEIGTLHWDLEARPFEIVQESDGFGWTAEDGMSEQVMEQLASNLDMLDALREENQTVKKRQLVYHNEELEKQRERILNGELKTLKIPGVDGELFDIDILSSSKILDEAYPDELNNGFIYGKISGRDDTKVSIGLSGESYSIQVNTLDRVLSISTRSGGELIVTEFDNALLDAQPSDPCRFGHGQGVGSLITE